MKIYEKNWFIILMLVLFFPVGLFLMWKNAKWHKTVKIIISVLFAVMVIFSNGSEESKNIETKDTNAEVETVKVDERKDKKIKYDSKLKKFDENTKVKGENKTERIQIRVSKEQKEILKTKSKKSNMTISEYVIYKTEI